MMDGQPGDSGGQGGGCGCASGNCAAGGCSDGSCDGNCDCGGCWPRSFCRNFNDWCRHDCFPRFVGLCGRRRHSRVRSIWARTATSVFTKVSTGALPLWGCWRRRRADRRGIDHSDLRPTRRCWAIIARNISSPPACFTARPANAVGKAVSSGTIWTTNIYDAVTVDQFAAI